jgi:hypothetical protein
VVKTLARSAAATLRGAATLVNLAMLCVVAFAAYVLLSRAWPDLMVAAGILRDLLSDPAGMARILTERSKDDLLSFGVAAARTYVTAIFGGAFLFLTVLGTSWLLSAMLRQLDHLAGGHVTFRLRRKPGSPDRKA